jgi:uncharacterized protein (TIGR03790 family)
MTACVSPSDRADGLTRGLLLAVLLLLTAPAGWAASREAAATVVLYNSADPVSTQLASYYAKRREIPSDQIVGLAAPLTPEISRAEFVATIARPLRDTFERRGWWTLSGDRVVQSKIRFLAILKGLPLKIRSDGEAVVPRTDQPPPIGQRDEASVDSELAALGFGKIPTSGVISNPAYRRFTPTVESVQDPGLLLIGRLDAPSANTVRAMIDGALTAERDGLWGWAYVDSRNMTTGGYAEGDTWLGNAARQMRDKGIPVLWDKAPETLPAGFPVTDAAVYLGWYADNVNGPFADPAFRFRVGAVAVHIHSFSAATLSDPNAGWSGPLVERGAAATLGNVYEPYLALTANLDVFQDRLMAGFTFAESAWYSIKVLSWMGVAVGDPLYKPYASWRGLDSGKSSWQRYRSIVLANDGKVVDAAKPLAVAARESGNSMFYEALGAAQADAGDLDAAMQSIESALTLKNPPLVRFRLNLEKLGILQAWKKRDEAGALIRAEKTKAPGPAQAALLDGIYLRIFPPPPTPTPAPSPAKK